MRFLVTGGAGFIGSNIAEELLNRGEEVIVLDNLSTGKLHNVESFMDNLNFRLIKGTITDYNTCQAVCEGMDYVFHEAAYISVPGSVKDPTGTSDTNVNGTVNIFNAAREAGVKKVVWASSTAVYGNSYILPNVETMPFSPLSPYAASKASGEMFTKAFSEVYGFPIIALRYYNVFGKRQDPKSQYAAAIPVFVSKLLKGEPVTIYGDGEQTRDFVYIDNVVQANIKAALDSKPEASGKAFNVGCGKSITINKLYTIIAQELGVDSEPLYDYPREGDVHDSLADISNAKKAFGYNPEICVEEGLKRSIEWYRENYV